MSLQTVELAAPAEITVFRPYSLDELRACVSSSPPPHYFLAGGTDLLVQHKDGVIGSSTWIDVTGISELTGISLLDGHVRIGALASHEEMARSPIIQRYAPALVDGCAVIGGPQIRWRGTIAGNLANASPAADTVPALYTLGATVDLLAVDGSTRRVDVAELATAPRRSILAPGELITAVHFEAREHARGGFLRLGQRQAQAISKVSVAVTAVLQGTGADATRPALTDASSGSGAFKIGFAYLRIACGSVAPTVIRAPRTEQILLENGYTPSAVIAATETICEEVRPIDDVRSNATYRRAMAGVLLKKVLARIL